MSRASLVEFWRARSPREQAILAIGAAAVVLAALYAFLWEPGLAARRKLSASLPVLRAQLEDMRRAQREIAALRKKLGTGPAQPDLRKLLEASLARSTLAGAIDRLEALSAQRVRVQAASIEFDAWLDWIESLQRGFGVRIETCKITALDARGRVRIDSQLVSGGTP